MDELALRRDRLASSRGRRARAGSCRTEPRSPARPVRRPGRGRRGIQSGASPSRWSPAAASTSASHSPSRSLRNRVSTLPRTGSTSRSVRSARTWALRRRLLVPTRAPVGRAASDAAPQIPSRGSSRAGIAISSRPGGSSVGTSFAECTATSIRSSRSARSSSDTQRDLSSTGPAALIVTSSVSPSIRSATHRAWVSASALPRVPTRINAGAARGPPPAPQVRCRSLPHRRRRCRVRTARGRAPCGRARGHRGALSSARSARGADG